MRLLDLFCGAGGAAMGYHQAGFTEIVGVDVEPQPNYPFEFVQMDALEFLRISHPTDGDGPWSLEEFDLVHASPPCQSHTQLSVNRWGKEAARWPDLIAPTRERLEASGTPYVIENVTGARKALRDPMLLSGPMFGLSVYRPRLFELGGWFTLSPPTVRRQEDAVAVYGKPDGRFLWRRQDGSELRAWSSIEEGQEALGVWWMTDELEIREAIPPAYTRFLGEQFLAQHEVEAS